MPKPLYVTPAIWRKMLRLACEGVDSRLQVGLQNVLRAYVAGYIPQRDDVQVAHALLREMGDD